MGVPLPSPPVCLRGARRASGSSALLTTDPSLGVVDTSPFGSPSAILVSCVADAAP